MELDRRERGLVVHKYRMLKGTWGIAINIYGAVYDYDVYVKNNCNFQNENVSDICEGVSVYFDPEKNENIGPNDAYNEMNPDDYPYVIEGMKNVSQQIKANADFKKTLIVITRLEFNPCHFQEEGLIAASMEWCGKAFHFSCPQIEARFQKDINKYIYDF